MLIAYTSVYTGFHPTRQSQFCHLFEIVLVLEQFFDNKFRAQVINSMLFRVLSLGSFRPRLEGFQPFLRLAGNADGFLRGNRRKSLKKRLRTDKYA